jgi:hypothetical protein
MKFVVHLFFMLPTIAVAQQKAGQAETSILSSILSGNLGLFIGLIAGASGVYIWLIRRESWGLILLILGVLFTAFPELFESLYNSVNPLITTTGGTRTQINL